MTNIQLLYLYCFCRCELILRYDKLLTLGSFRFCPNYYCGGG